MNTTTLCARLRGAALGTFLLVAGIGLSAAAPAVPPAAGSADSAAPAVLQEGAGGGHADAGALQSGSGEFRPENASEVSRQSVHGEPLWVSLARLFNFAIVVGVLVYYLRAPISTYLARRSTEIRGDLVKAAETREVAVAELKEIEQKMAHLPAEIEALKARGAQEIAAEEARIRQAADTERERLLAQARREIDLHARAAERDLVKRAAELTVGLAEQRIRQTITDEDRKRLLDQNLEHLQR